MVRQRERWGGGVVVGRAPMETRVKRPLGGSRASLGPQHSSERSAASTAHECAKPAAGRDRETLRLGRGTIACGDAESLGERGEACSDAQSGLYGRRRLNSVAGPEALHSLCFRTYRARVPASARHRHVYAMRDLQVGESPASPAVRTADAARLRATCCSNLMCCGKSPSSFRTLHHPSKTTCDSGRRESGSSDLKPAGILEVGSGYPPRVIQEARVPSAGAEGRVPNILCIRRSEKCHAREEQRCRSTTHPVAADCADGDLVRFGFKV